MATPPGNGIRNVNSVMMEIALHLVEPCVTASTETTITANSVQTVSVTSTVGMYVGAQVVVSNANQSSQTILTITAFDPVALTVTGNFLSGYPIGSLLTGATFPTQQPTDPLWTQAEIAGYIARAQNEFLAKIPCIFDFFEQFALNVGQTFYSLPANAVELERVALQTSAATGTIVSIVRVGGVVTCTLDSDYGFLNNITVNVAGVADATFDGTYTTTSVSLDGTILTWLQYDGSPDATSTGGTASFAILSRMYEVTQNELTMRDPQWFYNPGTLPTAWYEDRTGVYGWGVAGVPQSNFLSELICSVRDSEVLALTDHFLLPDIFLAYPKYKALQYCYSKSGEQASPTLARLCGTRFDRGVMMADRYLRNVLEATNSR